MRFNVAAWKPSASTIAWAMSRICSRRSSAVIRRRGGLCCAMLDEVLTLRKLQPSPCKYDRELGMHENMHYAGLADRVHRQQALQPVLYGDVDFDIQPYRLATAPD